MAFTLRGIGIPVLLALATGVAKSQTTQPGSTTAASVRPSASSSEPPSARPIYKSALEGYRPFADQPLTPWRESNDTVARVGGWKAYAREGQGEPSEGADAMPADHAGMDMRSSATSGTPAPMSPAASSPGASLSPVKVPSASMTRPAPGAASGTRPAGQTEQKKP